MLTTVLVCVHVHNTINLSTLHEQLPLYLMRAEQYWPPQSPPPPTIQCRKYLHPDASHKQSQIFNSRVGFDSPDSTAETKHHHSTSMWVESVHMFYNFILQVIYLNFSHMWKAANGFSIRSDEAKPHEQATMSETVENSLVRRITD